MLPWYDPHDPHDPYDTNRLHDPHHPYDPHPHHPQTCLGLCLALCHHPHVPPAACLTTS